jgi:hypothetical protein
MFTKAELQALDALAAGKKLESADEKHVESLKGKLGTSRQDELVERFRNLTGWTNKPSDYA